MLFRSLAYLYGAEMKYDAKNPKMEDRDRLVLSKGHAAPALYGVISLLEEKGRLSEDQINSIRRETRPEKQTEWFKLAIKVDTIDEFFKKANIKRQ